MNSLNIKRCLVIVICISTSMVHAGLFDNLKSIFKSDEGETGIAESVSALTNDEMVAGLKEALIKGANAAVTILGKEDGFLNSADVKIPMPESLKTVESALRKIGQDKYADSFIETLNRAAEQAVPVAADVFSDSVKNMSIEDAKGILSGADDAATAYFQQTSSDALKEKFLPIVKASTDTVGLTASYKDLVRKLGPLSGFMDTESLDLDNYVTDKAMDGLFLMLANEEKKIRENPLERTTEILKKVFDR